MNKSLFSDSVVQRLPPSTQRGLLELERNYQRMNFGSYSYASLIAQIEQALRIFSSILEDASCDSDNGSLLIEQLTSIQDGIQFINGAILNRLQSNRYLFEAEAFNAPNVGPFADLYQFYEELIDLFERLIVHYNQRIPDKEVVQDICFLLDITVHSPIRAELFVPRTCTQRKMRKLIGITLNEQSFFQMRDGIVLLLHEIGHHVRPFDRKARNKKLFDIIVDFQGLLVQKEVLELINPVLVNLSGTHGKKAYKKLTEVSRHFERVVVPDLMAVVHAVFDDLFAEFIGSKAYKADFGTRDPRFLSIREFSRVLLLFMVNLSSDLSQSIFHKSEAKSGIKEKIVAELKHRKNSNQNSVFEEMSEKATQLLFDKDWLLEYQNQSGGNPANTALDAYLRCLSILGLNEPSENNQKLLTEKLIQALRISVEATKDINFIDFFSTAFDEALADLFTLKALNIDSYEDYWELTQHLVNNVFHKKFDQQKFLAVRNAIIWEYYKPHQANGSMLQNRYDLTQAIDDFSPGRAPRGTVDALQKQIKELLIEPIAEHLRKQEQIFPENIIFKGLTERDTILIRTLRQYFKFLTNKDGMPPQFQVEISLINQFLGR